jgi:hypothetical protein
MDDLTPQGEEPQGEDLQPVPPPPHRPSRRVRAVQVATIGGGGALTVFMPALGTPILVTATICLIWVERRR